MTVVPGVTAALAVAAVLGAPLGHDHVMISLSDLHTAWPVIERRIAAAAEGDLVTCFYNPASKKRDWQLRRALELLAAHRPPDTPVGWVRDASRPGQAASLSTLAEFDPAVVDMHTLVVVGSSRTRVQAGRMVTPRDYRWAGRERHRRHNGRVPRLRRVPADLPRARDPAARGSPGRPRRALHRMRRVRRSLPGRRDRDDDMTEVHPIEAESYRILRSRIDLSALPPLTRAVTERVIHATADFDYVTDLVCDEAALAAGVEALRRDAPVIADVAMVASGITGYPVICKIGDSLSARLARTANITLSAAAVRLAHGEAGPGAIWLVGCAPTALAEIMSRQVEPALVIGVPVGFVGAAAAKDDLRASGLPALSNVSEKGGSAVAVAAFNALLRVARKLREGLLVTPPAASCLPPPLLLAAHGTRDPAGVAAFHALAARVATWPPPDGTRVAGGFIELSAPPLRDAVAAPGRHLPGGHGRGAADAVRGRARQGRHPRRAGPRAHPASRPAA